MDANLLQSTQTGGGGGMNASEPPDDWDEEIPVPTSAKRGGGRRNDDRRPILSADEEEVRRLWVFAMRELHESRNGGTPSRYDSHPSWDGGVCQTTGRRYEKAFWPEFVAKASAAGYSPRELIEVLFSSWSDDKAPTPPAAVSNTNIQRAAKYRLLRRRRISDSLRTEESVYKANLWGVLQAIPDKVEANRFVLNDTSAILSPLFRYSLAVLAKLSDVAERWNKAAVAQFQSDAPAYLEHWSTLIPDTIKQTAQTAA